MARQACRTQADFPEVGLDLGGFVANRDQLCRVGWRGVEIGEMLQVRMPGLRRAEGASACRRGKSGHDDAEEVGLSIQGYIQGYAVLAAFSPSRSSTCCRIMNFWIFPVTVIGNSSTNST